MTYHPSKLKNVAIVGATGAVGKELVNTLEKRNFPIQQLHLFASKQSLGLKLAFKNQNIPVQILTPQKFQSSDIVFFAAGNQITQNYAKYAVDQGCTVIDLSSVYRMSHEVPLVIPEINQRDIGFHKGLIANPNCSTILLCMAISPIKKEFQINKILVSTYQAVSGAGKQGIHELIQQTQDYLQNQPIKTQKFQHQIAFNLFSHDSKTDPDGYNLEEKKIENETKKIFHDPHLQISSTCIRVPIIRAHTESVYLEFNDQVDLKKIKTIFQKTPGIQIIDHYQNNEFPMPSIATEQDDIFVGRIRKSFDYGLSILICGDQLLKGAALNAVQIAELLI